MPFALPLLAPGPLVVRRLRAVGILANTDTMAGSVLMALLLLAGCSGIGPGTVPRDRFDSTAAVAESWKSQMLLNLVKMRYGDTPVFLDVGQIVTGYTVQSTFSATGNIFNTSATVPRVPNSSIGLSAQGQFIDRPTITYAPLVGGRFARSMMTPIPPSAILHVIQAGFPVDVVFRLGVQAVNGVDNRRMQLQHIRPANPEFYVLLRDFRRLQASGDIGVRRRRVDKEELLTLVLRPHLAAAVEHALVNVLTVLGLDPAAREFRVVYGAVATNDDAPPPKIYEWTNPRYDYAPVKGSVWHRRLGALATFLFEERVIPHPVDVSEAMDVSLITEALEAWKRSQ